MTQTQSPKDSLMVKQVSFVIVVRRIKILGTAITAGIVVIYLAGLIVAGSNHIEDFETVNLITLLIAAAAVPFSLFIKKLFSKKANLSNFTSAYFNAHVIPFATMDFAGLLCVTTNLFVNGNILYATLGTVLSAAGMIMLFPKESDFEELKMQNMNR